MKRLFFVSVLVLINLQYSVWAQEFLTSSEKPKYLPENKAEKYLHLTVSKKNEVLKIQIESMEDSRDHTFYVLKGSRDATGALHWQIVKEFNNENKKGFRETYQDGSPDSGTSVYRVMVKHENDKIEYSPIVGYSSSSENLRQVSSGT
jgi:hypothetical protein